MTLERHILNVLQRVEPQSLFETTLASELHVIIGSRPGQQALREALANLKRLGWIKSATDPLTQDTQWEITESGKGK